jgi:hypothetical protein
MVKRGETKRRMGWLDYPYDNPCNSVVAPYARERSSVSGTGNSEDFSRTGG